MRHRLADPKGQCGQTGPRPDRQVRTRTWQGEQERVPLDSRPQEDREAGRQGDPVDLHLRPVWQEEARHHHLRHQRLEVQAGVGRRQ